MSGDPQPSPDSRRRHVLRYAIAAIGLAIAVTCAALAWWIYDTGDLGAVRARARAQGVAVDWSGFTLGTSPPSDIERQMDVVTAAKHLTSFAEANPGGGLQPFQAIPAKVAEHYARQDQAALEGLARAVDALPDRVVNLDASSSFDAPALFAARNRRIAEILRDRVLLAPVGTVCREARRLVRFVASLAPLPDPGGWGSYEMGVSTVATIAARLADLKTDGAALADDLERFAHQTLANQRLVARAIFVMTMQAAPDGLRHVHHGNLFKFRGWPAPMAPILERAGRAAALDVWLQGITLLDGVEADHNGTWRWLSFSHHRFSANLASSSPAADIEAGMDMATWFDATWPEETALHARLLAAELKDTPWPTDSLSPDAVPLHRLVRNGTVIGAYSLNPYFNAALVDLQGKRPNRFFALYGPRTEVSKPSP